MNTRDQQYITRKQQIKDIALALFVTYNLEGTTTKSIANAANTSSGLLFHYYESKECLYFELYETFIKQIEVLLLPDKKAQTPIAIIESVINNVLEYLSIGNNVQGFLLISNVFINQFSYPETDKLNTVLKTRVNSFKPLIILGQQMDEILDGDSSTYMYLLLYALYGAAMSQFMNNTPLPKAEYILRMIKK